MYVFNVYVHVRVVVLIEENAWNIIRKVRGRDLMVKACMIEVYSELAYQVSHFV